MGFSAGREPPDGYACNRFAKELVASAPAIRVRGVDAARWGALGAYQVGVYQALEEAGIRPDWVAGISIGAINAAIIAGNPQGRASRGCANSGQR